MGAAALRSHPHSLHRPPAHDKCLGRSTCHTILGPILPVYVKSFDLGQFGTFAAGASVSLFAVGRLLAKMPAGQMGDYFGRKAMLVWGPALTAVGMLMSGYVGSYWELLAWRFFTGIGSSIQARAQSGCRSTPASSLRRDIGSLASVCR